MGLFSDDNWAGALGSFASAGINYVATSHGAYKQYKYQRKLQDQAYQQSRQFRRSSYQDTVKSLRKANLNPALAYGNGAVSTGFQSAGTAQSEDYSGAVSSALDALRLRKENKLTDAQTHNIDTQTYKNQMENYYFPSIQEATIDNIKSNTALQEMQTTGQMITNKYLPRKMKAEIFSLYNNAKANLTNAQANMNNASSNSWYNYHRSLGFGESKNNSAQKNFSVHGLGFGIDYGYSRGKGRSKNY